MPAHLYPVEVRSYEVDFLGHVNNATYLNYMEQARMTWLKENGWDLVRMHRESSPHTLVVGAIEAHFRKPCYYGDELEVRTTVSRIGRSSFDLQQNIFRRGEEKPVFEATLVAVFISSRGKPISIVPELRQLLLTLQDERSAAP